MTTLEMQVLTDLKAELKSAQGQVAYCNKRIAENQTPWVVKEYQAVIAGLEAKIPDLKKRIASLEVYLSPISIQPLIVIEPGSYKTRAGEVVAVTLVPPALWYGSLCAGAYPNGIKEKWYPCGRVFENRLTQNDIVSPA